MNILFLTSGYDGCGYYRVELPARYLNKVPGVHAKIAIQYMKEDIHWADIIVLQKQVNQKALPFVQYAKSLGKKVVTEVDDDYFNIPISNPAHAYYHDKSEELINFYKLSDAMTVTTDYLNKHLSQYNKNIYTLPNSLYFSQIDRFSIMEKDELSKYTQYITSGRKPISLEEVEELKKDKVVLGWGGSPTHMKDLETATDALIRLCTENENVLVTMMACTTDKISQCLSPDQLLLVKPVPIFLYHQVLASMGWDFGICPIDDSLFNKSKSNLKFLEFSNAGYPCICSDVENYAKTVTPRETGLLAKNTEESWYENLYEMLNNESLRKHMKKKSQEYVRKNYDMADNCTLWLKAYEEILDS